MCAKFGDHRHNVFDLSRGNRTNVTIGDQLDELYSFSGSLPHVYLY